MRPLVKWNVLTLALAVGLVMATGAYADTLSWSVSGTNISGSGTMTATNEAGGEYLVTAMTGSLDINGVGGLITFIPWTGTLGTPDTLVSGGTKYTYDDLVFPSSTPNLDAYGLLFDVAGFANPVNLCVGATSNCGSSGSQAWLAVDSDGLGAPVTFSATVSEPSALGLLSLGLLGMMFLVGRKQLQVC